MLTSEFPHGKISYLECDVTDRFQLENCIKKAIEQHGHIDVLINNAGAILFGPYESMNEADFRAQMEIHLFAILNSVNAILPHFKSRRKGQVVNICSLGGQMAVPHMLPYDASKFALSGYSQGIAAELKKHNVFVTTVYPELMMTGSPIQAIFKGDAKKGFTIFAISDYLPFFVVSADKAAKKIVNAIVSPKHVVMFSLFSKVRVLAMALFPNTMIRIFAMVSKRLPQSAKDHYLTGAEVKPRSEKFNKYFGEKSKKIEAKYNQRPKGNAPRQLGLE